MIRPGETQTQPLFSSSIKLNPLTSNPNNESLWLSPFLSSNSPAQHRSRIERERIHDVSRLPSPSLWQKRWRVFSAWGRAPHIPPSPYECRNDMYVRDAFLFTSYSFSCICGSIIVFLFFPHLSLPMHSVRRLVFDTEKDGLDSERLPKLDTIILPLFGPSRYFLWSH